MMVSTTSGARDDGGDLGRGGGRRRRVVSERADCWLHDGGATLSSRRQMLQGRASEAVVCAVQITSDALNFFRRRGSSRAAILDTRLACDIFLRSYQNM